MVRLAFKNLRRNRRRNAATGIAIALGFAGLILLEAYYNRAFNFLRVFTLYPGYGGHVAIMKHDFLDKGSSDAKKYSIDRQMQERIDKTLADVKDEIAFSTWVLKGEGLIGNGCRSIPFLAFGVDPGLDDFVQRNEEVLHWAPEAAHFEEGSSFSRFPDSVGPLALSKGLARLLGKRKLLAPGEKLSEEIVIPDCTAKNFALDSNVQLLATTWAGFTNVVDGEVVYRFSTGFAETENSFLRLPLQRLQKLYDTDYVSQKLIWVKDATRIKKILAVLRSATVDLPLDYFTWDDAAYNPYLMGTLSFLGTMLFFIGMVLLLIVAFSIVNAVTITLLERYQETGMMRSFGFSQQEIRRLYLVETLLLTTISVVCGAVLVSLVIIVVNRAGIQFSPPGISGGIKLKLIPDPFLVMMSVLLIYLVAFLATLIATARAAKIKIVDLLSGHRQ